jgi:acetyl esterase
LRLLGRAMQLANRLGGGSTIEEQAARPLEERQANRPDPRWCSPGPAGVAREDRSIPTRAGQVAVRLHRALDRSRPQPGVVYLHGGGWIAGGLASCEVLCDRIASLTGATVVSVDYRLAPEHPFPHGLQDCHDVVTWLRSEGRTLDLDPSRLAVVGESAGGNLAAAVTLLDRGSTPPLRAQVLVYPALDATGSSDYVRHFRGPGLSRRESRQLVALYAQGVDEADPLISPLLADDHSGLPPALVLTGGADLLAAEGEAYVRALTASGTEAELLHLPRAPHAFFNFDRLLPEVPAALATACAFLRQHLRDDVRVDH